ncbi:MAG: hypothetical protein JSS86_20185 [Cyanobacteria bacterium SZAS LIN-2]|nr:hypothetical protein [Cyanobacteria bacterium SZAS LIN-2]
MDGVKVALGRQKSTDGRGGLFVLMAAVTVVMGTVRRDVGLRVGRVATSRAEEEENKKEYGEQQQAAHTECAWHSGLLKIEARESF